LMAHRINGYVIILLAILGNVGALMIARHAFGGDFASQSAIGILIVGTYVGLVLAYINIKRKRIDLHRAWMLRTWAYFGTIITMRVIMIISATIVSGMKMASVEPCGKIDYMLDGDRAEVVRRYRGCEAYYSGEDVGRKVAVEAMMNAGGTKAEVAALFNLTAGGSLWLALVVHAVAVEVYVSVSACLNDWGLIC
jgi:hypothetical protein